MPSWSRLLKAEREAEHQIREEELFTGQTLFEKFKPNPGGQEQFFKLQNWKSLNPPIEHRWCALAGGIGCLAGETLIEGVPIAEIKNDWVVTTLIGKAKSTFGYIKGIDDLYLVKMKSGNSVTVTVDHKFLTPRGWFPLKSLQVGCQIAGNSDKRIIQIVQETPTEVFLHHKIGEWGDIATIFDFVIADPSFPIFPFWDEIEKISFVRKDQYYDLHVPVINHYLANNIWHHNSGKSFSGAAWACSRALLDPKATGLIVANTFGQLGSATLIELVKVCRMFDIPLRPYREGENENAMTIANSRWCEIGEERAHVFVRAATSFTGKIQSARGMQVRWCWGDEMAYASEKSFLTIDGRLGRGGGTMKGQGVLTTSPVGYNWLWEKFGDPTRDPELQRIYKLIRCSSVENVANLGEDYIASLRANYTDELYEQEMLGMFVNTTTGLVYKYFDRTTHTLQGSETAILEYDRHLPLYLSFDFNATPCICLAAQQRGQEIHFFREWFMLDADLWELCDVVRHWILKAGVPPELHIFGDATGRARTAQSKLSSWDIVWESLKPVSRQIRGGLTKRFGDSNPYVVNRVHSVNLGFREQRIYMDLKACQNLVKDFEVLSWDNGSINKDEDALRSHVSDAAGYLIHKIHPFKSEPEIRRGFQQKRVAGLAF